MKKSQRTSHEHVPYFETAKIKFLIALSKSTNSANALEKLQQRAIDVHNEIDAYLFEFAQCGRDIEIGYNVEKNRKEYARINTTISHLEELRQQISDTIDPPTEYIAFVEYKRVGAIWAQRRLTDGCRRPRADDRQISKAKRYDTQDVEEFLKTLIYEGHMQPTYRILPEDRNPMRTTLIG